MTDLALALGGGGARGFAHIGVISQLEKRGFHMKALAGTSAGGIVACCIAAGYTPRELESLFEGLDQSKLFPLSTEGPSVLELSRARKILDDILGAKCFSDLKIPCAVVSVNIKTGEEIIHKDGRLVDALMATIAVPGVFPPMMMDEHELVDGGVLNPVPVSIARSLAPRLPVVAVVLSQGMKRSSEMPHITLPIKIPGPIVERITHMRVSQALAVFMQSVDIGQRKMTVLRLLVDQPDFIIRPDVDDIGLLDRVDAREVILRGSRAVDKVYSELKRSLSWPHRRRRVIFPGAG
jgi:NTE family protein